jgi:uncharacterized protein YndB with AHSA1/START domain
MADILHDLPIRASIERVFRAVSTAEGLDTWWTLRATGTPHEGAEYELGFGPGYDWRAKVTRCEPNDAFELEIVDADGDWTRTRVGLRLEPRDDGTWVRFSHRGWPSANDHFRVSSNCWALYLRVLRRSLEHGESVPYDARLDA